MKSIMTIEQLKKIGTEYLALAEHSDEKVEAFREVLAYEIEVAAKERRHEDHGLLHTLYHEIIMSVPLFEEKS